ncbi:hypothetical protein AVEN_79595-1 [Araneus ventricosus]|uniref:Uncharacterized protein n=1 Tax=Araneus ventricosus TaxID=182803 RepID=A0A4Y2TAA5_ARAVE|nr:hypothetical protein AVEN_79595-1 [Araneus ventricosus]
MAQRARREDRRNRKNKEIADCVMQYNVARREEPKEQMNKEIADCQNMVQHARERRLNVIEGQNQHQIQTFMQLEIVLELKNTFNCGEMDNLCLKCGSNT